MPNYEYECCDPDCQVIHQRYFTIAEAPDRIICSNCGWWAERIISRININTGAGKARVYYQFKGKPEECPPEVREALRVQDRPKGLPESARDAMPVVPEGKRQEGIEKF